MESSNVRTLNSSNIFASHLHSNCISAIVKSEIGSERGVEMTELREIATGLRFPEGPVAMSDGSVILVEIAASRLSRVAPDGTISVVAETGGGPHGAARSERWPPSVARLDSLVVASRGPPPNASRRISGGHLIIFGMPPWKQTLLEHKRPS